MDKFDERLHKFRKLQLAGAEMVDAWRIIPRIVLAGYSYLVGYMVWFFLTQNNVPKVDCNAAVLKVLLDQGEGLAQAQEVACHVVDVLGPPTSLTSLVSVIVGASAAVFGLYGKGSRDFSHPPAYWNGSKEKKKEKSEVLIEDSDVE